MSVTGERKLIVLDIDGTILLEDESPSPGVVDAIRRAREAGHEVMIATGRAWPATQAIMARLGISSDYVVCSNGAIVLARVPGSADEYQTIHAETFDGTAALEVLWQGMPEAHYMVELPSGKRLYTNFFEDWALGEADQVPFDDLPRKDISRIVVIDPDKEERDFVRIVDDLGLNRFSYAVGWSAWLDVAPIGVDKATGLELVREKLGIDPQNVITIGDGRNDIGMLEWARDGGGRAIAMGQGPAEVLAAGNEVADSVYNGGVAKVIDALLVPDAVH